MASLRTASEIQALPEMGGQAGGFTASLNNWLDVEQRAIERFLGREFSALDDSEQRRFNTALDQLVFWNWMFPNYPLRRKDIFDTLRVPGVAEVLGGVASPGDVTPVTSTYEAPTRALTSKDILSALPTPVDEQVLSADVEGNTVSLKWTTPVNEVTLASILALVSGTATDEQVLTAEVSGGTTTLKWTTPQPAVSLSQVLALISGTPTDGQFVQAQVSGGNTTLRFSDITFPDPTLAQFLAIVSGSAPTDNQVLTASVVGGNTTIDWSTINFPAPTLAQILALVTGSASDEQVLTAEVSGGATTLKWTTPTASLTLAQWTALATNTPTNDQIPVLKVAGGNTTMTFEDKPAGFDVSTLDDRFDAAKQIYLAWRGEYNPLIASDFGAAALTQATSGGNTPDLGWDDTGQYLGIGNSVTGNQKSAVYYTNELVRLDFLIVNMDIGFAWGERWGGFFFIGGNTPNIGGSERDIKAGIVAFFETGDLANPPGSFWQLQFKHVGTAGQLGAPVANLTAEPGQTEATVSDRTLRFTPSTTPTGGAQYRIRIAFVHVVGAVGIYINSTKVATLTYNGDQYPFKRALASDLNLAPYKEWDSATTYTANTRVSVRATSKSYRASTSSGNLNKVPGAPGNTEYWTEITNILPAWTSASSGYAVGDRVQQGGIGYECVIAHTNNRDPGNASNANSWKVIPWWPAWVTGTTYGINRPVSRSGKYYRSRISHSGQDPATNPKDANGNDYWQEVTVGGFYNARFGNFGFQTNPRGGDDFDMRLYAMSISQASEEEINEEFVG